MIAVFLLFNISMSERACSLHILCVSDSRYTLTELNSLTHILDFDYEHDHNDSLESIQTSQYYTELDFIKMCTPDTCAIMSINCQSLNAKYDYIKFLLNVFTQHEQPFQVVCLQETWIEDASLIDLADDLASNPTKMFIGVFIDHLTHRLLN